jgi:hypothetical protein
MFDPNLVQNDFFYQRGESTFQSSIKFIRQMYFMISQNLGRDFHSFGTEEVAVIFSWHRAFKGSGQLRITPSLSLKKKMSFLL